MSRVNVDGRRRRWRGRRGSENYRTDTADCILHRVPMSHGFRKRRAVVSVFTVCLIENVQINERLRGRRENNLLTRLRKINNWALST